MFHTIRLERNLNCTLERAFKTPMLCDVSRVHTGMGPMPPITHTTDDDDWGQIGSTKKVYAHATLLQKGGFVSIDKIVNRIENQLWEIEVSDFQSWMLSFYKFEGRWETKEMTPGKIHVKYTYRLHFKNPLFIVLTTPFAYFFWRRYMSQVLNNIEKMIEEEIPYLYS